MSFDTPKPGSGSQSLAALESLELVCSRQGDHGKWCPIDISPTEILIPLFVESRHTPGIDAGHRQVPLGVLHADEDIGSNRLIDTTAITPRVRSWKEAFKEVLLERVAEELVETGYLSRLYRLNRVLAGVECAEPRGPERGPVKWGPGEAHLWVDLLPGCFTIRLEEICADTERHVHVIGEKELRIRIDVSPFCIVVGTTGKRLSR